MSDYIGTSYDKILQDEDNFSMTNAHARRMSEYDEVEDETFDYDLDDWDTQVERNDYVFSCYFKRPDGSERKFVLQQENFLTALDRYGTQNLVMGKLHIIDGEDWLNYQKGAYE